MGPHDCRAPRLLRHALPLALPLALAASLAAACTTAGQRTSGASSDPASPPPAASDAASASATSASRAVTMGTSPPDPALAPAAAPEQLDPRFEADLLAIADTYTWMTRADGLWLALADCVAPVHPTFVSKAEAGGHARKIYTLFVEDFAAYAALSGQKGAPRHALPATRPLDAMEQVVVKEAWTPVENSAPRDACPEDGQPSYLTAVMMDGKAYRACAQAGLFVMYRPKAASEGTDEGWVYGTVRFERPATPPTKVGDRALVPRVTSAGRVASCMRCHTKAPHGRLFGLPASK